MTSAAAVKRLLAASATVPTPALVVDLSAADFNIARAITDTAPLQLRPHFKAHKTTALLRRQCPNGQGVTCATSYEAIAIARAGFADILIANEVVDSSAIDGLALAASAARVTVAVDSLRSVSLLAQALSRRRLSVGVLLEIDVGHHRCGLEPMTDAVLRLARTVQESPALRLRGIMGYEGHAALERNADERRSLFRAACATLANERIRLIAAGFPCEVVSGGSRGTAELAAELGVLTEVQAGSYVLMDSQYAELQLGYRQALFCIATVISVRPGQIVVNAGLKSLNGDGPPPAVCARGLRATRVNDEHTIIQSMEGAAQPQVGDRILLVPSHVDPTLNLHPRITAVDRGGGIQYWTVDGRL